MPAPPPPPPPPGPPPPPTLALVSCQDTWTCSAQTSCWGVLKLRAAFGCVLLSAISCKNSTSAESVHDRLRQMLFSLFQVCFLHFGSVSVIVYPCTYVPGQYGKAVFEPIGAARKERSPKWHLQRIQAKENGHQWQEWTPTGQYVSVPATSTSTFFTVCR